MIHEQQDQFGNVVFSSYLSELHFSVSVSPLTAPTKQMSGHFTLKTQKTSTLACPSTFSTDSNRYLHHSPTFNSNNITKGSVRFTVSACWDASGLQTSSFVPHIKLYSFEKKHGAFGLTTANVPHDTRERMLNSEKRLSDIAGQVQSPLSGSPGSAELTGELCM